VGGCRLSLGQDASACLVGKKEKERTSLQIQDRSHVHFVSMFLSSDHQGECSKEGKFSEHAWVRGGVVEWMKVEVSGPSFAS
jgi:hypothetical protein